MSPEKAEPDMESDPWWLFLPGESFIDSHGRTCTNIFKEPVPIRVYLLPVGLMIQAFGENYFVDGATDFPDIVMSPRSPRAGHPAADI